MLIRDVIRNREPYSTKASATVQEAAEFMAARNIGAVCVIDDEGRLLEPAYERRADKFIDELIWMARTLRHGRETIPIS